MRQAVGVTIETGRLGGEQSLDRVSMSVDRLDVADVWSDQVRVRGFLTDGSLKGAPGASRTAHRLTTDATRPPLSHVFLP
jgi:hypothetical protein